MIANTACGCKERKLKILNESRTPEEQAKHFESLCNSCRHFKDCSEHSEGDS